MIESGPSSGVWGAAELGRLTGNLNVISLDIGGTTAKCSLIEDGNVRIVTDYWIERDRKSAGYPVMVPVVDLVEIGNGGGSIAWVDEFGKLHVGPQSAGAVPGPAAYGNGGVDATTTDANLWLGRINRDYFCGGELTADMGAAGRAIEATRQCNSEWTPIRPPGASSASPTTTWSTPSSSCHSTGDTIRGTSRWLRSAEGAECMPLPLRGNSESGRC